MATIEKMKEAEDIREVLAKAEKFYQRYATLGKTLDIFTAEYRSLKAEIVHLLNEKDALRRLNMDAALQLSKTEREAQTRLQTVEQGHRALIDNLSKKQIELENKLAEVEKRENHAAAERHKYELLNDEVNRRLAGLTAIKK